MKDEKLTINRFIGNISSYVHKILFLSMEYLYKACDLTEEKHEIFHPG